MDVLAAPIKTTSNSLVNVWHTYRISIVLGSISLVFIIISVILLVKSVQTTTPIEFSDAHEASVAGQMTPSIVVDIEGAVNKPGLYTLPDGARVGELMERAGGLTGEADKEAIAKTINLATKLVDGAKIYIPTIGDSNSPSNIVRRETMTTQTGATLMNINTASLSELESLPGVGPVTAGKIIEYRPYQVLTELVTKKAVSQSLFNKIKDSLSL